MKFAVFFRNLNLGRPPAPTRSVLEQSFLDAGAASAESFLTNGTLVFEASGARLAATVLGGACERLKQGSGFDEPAFLRRVDHLAKLVAREPFADVDPASVYERAITFLPPRFRVPADAPRANKKGDVQVLDYAGGEVFSVCHQFGRSPGSPNAFIEKQFAIVASTRAWNTVCRLVARHHG
jgi:uncharacterized protein (DUF1697 family)